MTPKIPGLSREHSQVASQTCALTLYPILITGLSGKVTPRTDAERKSGSALCLTSPLNLAGRGEEIKSSSKFPRAAPAPATHISTLRKALARSKVPLWL